MSCSCRKYAAYGSKRSAKIATSTLAPVTSSCPDPICIVDDGALNDALKPAVGFGILGSIGDQMQSSSGF